MQEPKLHENAIKILQKQKFCHEKAPGIYETPGDMFRRVANVVAQAESVWGATEGEITQVAEYFAAEMIAGRFIPNSPTLGNAGLPDAQLAACFVLPIDDSIASIYGTLKDAALIHVSGGGTGFSGARLRSKGTPVGHRGKTSDGILPFLKLYNTSSKEVLLQGARKGANMWVQPAWHPDIESFISCKKNDGEISQFNISVGASDAFMKAVESDDQWELYDPHTGDCVKTISARDLFMQIVDLAWETGDPGLFFLDRANRDNPTPKLGAFEATNPCGEQPLLPYEACTLGHLNLSKFVTQGRAEIRDSERWTTRIDWDGIRNTVRMAVQFLDNVVEINYYPLPQIEKMHKKGNRKIGVGVMGWADMLAILGIPYGSDDALELAEEMASRIRMWAADASVELAQERGSFPNFKKSALTTKYPKGVRNACVTTIAPTGTTGVILGASTAIEPFFGLVIVRKQAGMEMYEIHPPFRQWLDIHFTGEQADDIINWVAATGTIKGAPHLIPEQENLWLSANEIPWQAHIQMQAAWQRHIDSAVSKTINLPNNATREEIYNAYMQAWQHGCKGITVYRDGCRANQALNQAAATTSNVVQFPVTPKPPPDSPNLTEAVKDYGWDMYNIQNMLEKVPNAILEAAGLIRVEDAEKRFKSEPTPDVTTIGRPRVTVGGARKIPTGCGNAFIFIGNGPDGKIADIMGRLGKSGGCATAWWEAIGRVASIAIRSGVPVDEIIGQLGGISCHMPVTYFDAPGRKEDEKPPTIYSCADALATALREHLSEQTVQTNIQDINTYTYTDETSVKSNGNGHSTLDIPQPWTFTAPPLYSANTTTTTAAMSSPASFNKHAGCCPSCGSSALDVGAGCLVCKSCGYSRC